MVNFMLCVFYHNKKLQYSKQNTLVIKTDLLREFKEMWNMWKKQSIKLLTV